MVGWMDDVGWSSASGCEVSLGCASDEYADVRILRSLSRMYVRTMGSVPGQAVSDATWMCKWRVCGCAHTEMSLTDVREDVGVSRF